MATPDTPLDYFQMEAAERLQRLSSGLLALEQSPDDRALIDDLFREVHSLKGAAGVSGLVDVGEICHKMEELLGSILDGSQQATSSTIDRLLAASDAVQELVADRVQQRGGDIITLPDVVHSLDHPESFQEAAAPTAPGTEDGDSTAHGPGGLESPAASDQAPSPSGVDTPSAAAALGPARDTIRLQIDMLELLGNRTGELMVAADRLRQRLGSAREHGRLIRGERNGRRHNQGMQQTLRPIAAAVHGVVDDFTTDFAVIESLITEIHEQVLDTRMLPLSVLFDKLPRFVRDYCRQEGKQAELLIEGADTRVDRQLLEQLRDPMIHLIRNALSHGIEPSAQRRRSGKDPVGAVRLTTSQRGDRIRITCEDDGRGIDRRKLLDKAVTQGLISEADAAELPAEQVERLILRPGFSTAEVVTDVSGRGVGMDVVASRMEALRGTLYIESEPGKFTRFRLEFPASVATLEGLLVEVAGYAYVVPMFSVVRTARVKLSELQTGGGGQTLANIDGQTVPLVMLASLLGRGGCGKDAPHVLPVVVSWHRGRQIAFGVDRLVGTQSVVAKGLGDHIRTTPGVAGATILGSGLPALILEPGQLAHRGGTALFQHNARR